MSDETISNLSKSLEDLNKIILEYIENIKNCKFVCQDANNKIGKINASLKR